MEKLLSKYFIPGKTFGIDDYEKNGGYKAAKAVFERFPDPKGLIEEVKKSNQIGRAHV